MSVASKRDTIRQSKLLDNIRVAKKANLSSLIKSFAVKKVAINPIIDAMHPKNLNPKAFTPNNFIPRLIIQQVNGGL